MDERALTMRLLRHQNVGDSEEPVMLAQDLMGAGRVRDARLVCMTALHKDPTDVDLLLTGAGIAESLGECIDARTLLVKAARLAPDWIEPMARLSRLLYRMEDFGRAWAAVERCYVINPTSAETCALRADIEQAHRLTLRKHRFLNDEHADDAAMLANALVADARFDDALAVLDYALERDGEDADALFVKGTILKARGEREEAEIALRRVTQMECGWVEAWETMADLLEETGDRAHAERLRAHAATIEVDPLMLVDMAVIAGARDAAFNDLTMSEELDRAVAAGVSAMSDLKRSLTKARPSSVSASSAVGVNPSMLIRDVGSMFAEQNEVAQEHVVGSDEVTHDEPAHEATLDVASDEAPGVAAAQAAPEIVPVATIAVVHDEAQSTAHREDEIANPNLSDLRSGEDTLPLGTYKPTVARPGTVLFTTTEAKSDSERPGPRQNSGDAQEAIAEAPVALLRPKLPPSPLAPPPAKVSNPVSVRRIIDVRGHHDERREEVCIIRDGAAQPVSALLAETEADLDALLADDALFPAHPADETEAEQSDVLSIEAAGSDAVESETNAPEAEASPETLEASDEDLFPIDAEAAAFASVDIEVDFPIDAEAERFPSIDIDLAPLSTPPEPLEAATEQAEPLEAATEQAAPSSDAALRSQLVAYLSGPEFVRAGAGAHHVGFVATDAFAGPRCALRIRDGKVTLEPASLPVPEAVIEDALIQQAPAEVVPEEPSLETQQALSDLMAVQVSSNLSSESQVVFEELLSLQTSEPFLETDPFHGLEAADADTLFDDALPPGSVQTLSNEALSNEALSDEAPSEEAPSDEAPSEEMPEETLPKPPTRSDVLELLMETTTVAPAVTTSVVPSSNLGDASLGDANFMRANTVFNEDEDIAIPLAVRKQPRKTPVIRARPDDEGLDLRAQILAAAGVDANVLETALQATRLPGDLKQAEAELDCFLDEVEAKRPRLRMRSSKGTPYRPPSPRDLFPKHARDEESCEVTRR